jgi:hypothetical protein
MLLKKKKQSKTSQMIVDDIRHSFNKLISNNNSILTITINKLDFETAHEFRFNLTNRLFNKLHKDYKHSFEVINYLFVIEYPTNISLGKHMPSTCKPHAHIVLETTISQNIVEYYIKSTFRNPDIYIENITKRDDKLNYINYLIKQKHLLTDDNYNYKIDIQ